jgi:hypothetical protein
MNSERCIRANIKTAWEVDVRIVVVEVCDPDESGQAATEEK